jgi:hypothetical protein
MRRNGKARLRSLRWDRRRSNPATIKLTYHPAVFRCFHVNNDGAIGLRSESCSADACNLAPGRMTAQVIRYRSSDAENRFMSAMPRKRRRAVKMPPVAMGPKRPSALPESRWLEGSGKGRHLAGAQASGSPALRSPSTR